MVEFGTFSLSALLIALLGVLLNHALANSRDKIKERRIEGKRLIEEFQKELDSLRQTDQDCRLIMTESAFLRHESALAKYLPLLSWVDRLRLWNAWRRLAYSQQDKEKQIPFYEQYSDFGSLTKRRVIRPIIIKRISKIISLASK